MSAAAGASSSAAASQSTVFVTPAFLSTDFGPPVVSVYGYQEEIAGSLSGSSLYGKTISSVQSGTNSGGPSRLFISIAHGGTPLPQSFFRSVTLKGAAGTVNFSTSSLGTAGQFTANANGTHSTWSWKGNGVASSPWSVNDNAAQRTVAFFR